MWNLDNFFLKTVIVCFPNKTKVIDNMDYIRFPGSPIKLLLMMHSKLSNICLLVIQNICAHLPSAWVRKKGFKRMEFAVSSLASLQVRLSHLVRQGFIYILNGGLQICHEILTYLITATLPSEKWMIIHRQHKSTTISMYWWKIQAAKVNYLIFFLWIVLYYFFTTGEKLKFENILITNIFLEFR